VCAPFAWPYGHQLLVHIVGACGEIHLAHAAFGNQDCNQTSGAPFLSVLYAEGSGIVFPTKKCLALSQKVRKNGAPELGVEQD
jgi:hypothetical protein